jgi:multicomponent Na+:H+ antiporter subunit D
VFYRLLPYTTEFRPYSLDHVIGQTQLLFLSALAFTLLMRTGIYPPELRSTNLDFDWFYRRLGRAAVDSFGSAAAVGWARAGEILQRSAWSVQREFLRLHGPQGALTRSSPTGNMAFWVIVVLAVYLILANI